MSRPGLSFVVVALFLAAVSGFAQTAADQGTPAADSTPPTESPVALPAVTLEECVAAARVTSPNLNLASITMDTARMALAQAKAKNGLTLGESGAYYHRGSLPGLGTASTGNSNASGAAAGSGVNGENFQGGLSLSGPATSVGLTAQHSIAEGDSTDQVSSLSLSGSQTVFDGYPGGRAAGAVQEAETVFRVSQVSYDAAMKSVVYQVKQDYYTLLGDQDTVVLRQATVTQAAENLALYQGLFAAQRATKLDVLEVQVALTQAQLDVRTSQNTVVTDRKKLSLAIGWPLEKQFSAADSPLPDPPALGAAEALKSAFQNRSELLTLEQNIAAAVIALSLQKSQGLPVVSLTASLGVGQDWTANVNAGFFTAGVSIALPPILDGGLQDALVQQAADQLAAYKVQQAQQGQSIAIDVVNALFGVTDTRDRNALAAQNLQQAQGQYDLEKAKLAVGTGTTLDVLTAFSVLATARVGLAQAKSNYLLAVLNLYNVMGLEEVLQTKKD
jgi:outer membrane protein